MNRNLCALVLALASATAFAGPEKAPREGLTPNLAFGADAPGAIRVDVQVYIPDVKEPLRYELKADNGRISGGIYIPPGKERRVTIDAFDAHGEPIYSGAGFATIDEKLTREIRIPLSGKETKEPLGVTLGTYRLDLALLANEGDGLMLRATLLDGPGRHVPFKPEDLEWKLPFEFELLPYSCFLDSLCIELPERDRLYDDIIACIADFTCSKPSDQRGPYVYVAVGQNHTCALTATQDIRCWGDNWAGQLGTRTSECFTGRECSAVPVPVVCPPGEVCKFVSVAAGGDHTCAVDTAGKAWCWGSDGTWAAAEDGRGPGWTLAGHRHIPAFNRVGIRAHFVSIDTNIGHTCALSAANDVYCWGSNSRGELGSLPGIGAPSAQMVMNGNSYKSVVVGSMHTCAIQTTNGLMECWGDNRDLQLTGNVNNSTSITVNSKVPLLNNRGVSRVAAGNTTTCAQNSNDDTICWGRPVNNVASPLSAGFLALRYSYATSMATEVQSCGLGFRNCTRTCLTALGGDLFCGRWLSSGLHPMAEIKDPPNFSYISYTQVDVGPEHICAVNTNRDVWCFGVNFLGQFGTGQRDNTQTYVESPKQAAIR